MKFVLYLCIFWKMMYQFTKLIQNQISNIVCKQETISKQTVLESGVKRKWASSVCT